MTRTRDYETVYLLPPTEYVLCRNVGIRIFNNLSIMKEVFRLGIQVIFEVYTAGFDNPISKSLIKLESEE